MSRNVMVERAEAASNSRLRALLDAKAACKTIEFTPGVTWTQTGTKPAPRHLEISIYVRICTRHGKQCG